MPEWEAVNVVGAVRGRWEEVSEKRGMVVMGVRVEDTEEPWREPVQRVVSFKGGQCSLLGMASMCLGQS